MKAKKFSTLFAAALLLQVHGSYAQPSSPVGVGPIKLTAFFPEARKKVDENIVDDKNNVNCVCAIGKFCSYSVDSNKFDHFKILTYDDYIVRIAVEFPVESVSKGVNLISTNWVTPTLVSSDLPKSYSAYWSNPKFDNPKETFPEYAKYYARASVQMVGVVKKSPVMSLMFKDVAEMSGRAKAWVKCDG